jgi:hypothetical protein
LVGAIRAGGEKPERGVGKKLDAFRLTSPRKALVEQAAELYGGTVSAWRSPVGEEWQVYTETPELPVLVMPGYSLRQSYELWEGATKRVRLCDGVDEELSGGGCICASEGEDKCDIYTRLVVALPELDTALGWRLITRGANAAHELPTMLALIEARSAGASFVPARMRIDERRGVKDGQVVRFVVPTLDLGMGYAELAARAHVPALEPPPPAPAYETATRRSPSVEESLDALSAPRREPSGRTAELPDPELQGEAAPEPPDDGVIEEPQQASETQSKTLTPGQFKKLNVLVGQLRDEGHITTDGLYLAIGQLRSQAGLDLAMGVGGVDENGELHWAPLRDALTRPEANQLIEWLEKKRERVDKEASKAGVS